MACWRCMVVVCFGILVGLPGRATAQPLNVTIEAAVRAVLMPQRPGLDGVLTVADGGIYIQCLARARTSRWRCEAAGFEGQSWLTHVLTPGRQDTLIARGFTPDHETGNFVRDVPRSLPPEDLAALLIGVLTDGYGVPRDEIEVYSDWLPSRRCHLRLSADNVEGGALVTAHYGLESIRHASYSCSIVTRPNAMNYDDRKLPVPGMPASGPVDLDARYGAAMAAQLLRLEGKKPGEHRYAIFGIGTGYVQCLADVKGQQMYCEAASDDAVGLPLARILTPARKAKLLAAGFEPPGQSMNYARMYPYREYDPRAMAHALLAVLREGYGYQGAPELTLSIEHGPRDRPLLAIGQEP